MSTYKKMNEIYKEIKQDKRGAYLTRSMTIFPSEGGQLAELCFLLGVSVPELLSVYNSPGHYGFSGYWTVTLKIEATELEEVLVELTDSKSAWLEVSQNVVTLLAAEWPLSLKIKRAGRKLLRFLLDESKQNRKVLQLIYLKLLQQDAGIVEMLHDLLIYDSGAEIWIPQHITKNVVNRVPAPNLVKAIKKAASGRNIILRGGGKFIEMIIDSILSSRRLAHENHDIGSLAKSVGLNLELVRTFLDSDDPAARRIGVSLLLLTDLDVKSPGVRRELLGHMEKADDRFQAATWAQFIREFPVSSRQVDSWGELLEEILSQPRRFASAVIQRSAALRYFSLFGEPSPVISDDQHELGLPQL